jgi:anti-sigma regulatory factor (Ser/Thr protein kinase)
MIGEDKRNHAEQELLLDCDIAELERLTAFVDKFCEIESLSEEIGYHLQIALEELVLNAMKYGRCEPAKGSIHLSMKRQGNEVLAALSDNGIPFNPLDAAAPDTTSDVLDRQVGGLGIHLVRNLVHSLRYERRDGRNFLYFTKHVNPVPDTALP